MNIIVNSILHGLKFRNLVIFKEHVADEFIITVMINAVFVLFAILLNLFSAHVAAKFLSINLRCCNFIRILRKIALKYILALFIQLLILNPLINSWAIIAFTSPRSKHSSSLKCYTLQIVLRIFSLVLILIRILVPGDINSCIFGIWLLWTLLIALSLTFLHL